MNNNISLISYLKEKRKQINYALDLYLPSEKNESQILAAMRYSLLSGGKRLRAILCLAGAETVGGSAEKVMYCACALEMIHTYSLIHDDLPIIDDDNIRRGIPTNHKIFNEGVAILAGDALLTQAMILLSDISSIKNKNIKPRRALIAAQIIMQAAGWKGMLGGQALDLQSEYQLPKLTKVKSIHSRKTGALITASIQAGALLAGANKKQIKILVHYGQCIGLAFQIFDDLLNIKGHPNSLGKTTKSDKIKGKITYPATLGINKTKQIGKKLITKAVTLADSLGHQANLLKNLALYINYRTH